MKLASAVDLSRFLQATSNRAMYEHVGVELGFKNQADKSPGQSPFLVDIADISENRVVFCFPNSHPGLYAITDICFHDDGLLGAAIGMGYVDNPDKDIPRDSVEPANNPAIPEIDNPSSTLHINSDMLIKIGPSANSDIYGPDESWVIVFDLASNAGFADIICALSSGNLHITLKVKDLKTGAHSLLTNDPMPTLVKDRHPQQSTSSVYTEPEVPDSCAKG